MTRRYDDNGDPYQDDEPVQRPRTRRSPWDAVNGGKTPPAQTNQRNRVEFWQWPMPSAQALSDAGLAGPPLDQDDDDEEVAA